MDLKGPYAFPLTQQAKIIFWRRFNDFADWVRQPVRRREVLLVAGDAAITKVAEVETRLLFLLQNFDDSIPIRRVQAPSPLSYLRSHGIAAADPTVLHQFALHRLRWVTDLDYETNPLDGWELMELGSAMGDRRAQRRILSTARRTFVDHVRQLTAGKSRPAYLFGTGPSLQQARDRSFSDGITVVCNTIVRDADLWHHLRPAFLTAGDAIYHFGHNRHSRAFRKDALMRLQESRGETLFVYPAQFDVVVRPEFRDVHSQLIPIPYGEHTDATVDLTDRFRLPLLENVLANQLLPIGCTLSSDVRLWGFDGRAPDDTGFWANSSRQAYPELMHSIRDAHPAFFASKVPEGNETQYVKQAHGEVLEQRLSEAESRGIKFQMLHHSWTPTLQKRYQERTLDC